MFLKFCDTAHFNLKLTLALLAPVEEVSDEESTGDDIPYNDSGKPKTIGGDDENNEEGEEEEGP